MLDRNSMPRPQEFFSSMGLQLSGKGRWRTTQCKFHGGSDSMRVNMDNGAWVCMAACGARGGDVLSYYMAENCVSFIDAAKALGVWRKNDSSKVTSQLMAKPIAARDALEMLSREANIVAVIVLGRNSPDISWGKDKDRLLLAVRRINTIRGWFHEF